MKRRFQGLENCSHSEEATLKVVFLVRVDKVQYVWHAQKPSYLVRLAILEPNNSAGHTISGRLYCTPKSMWKLGWFLRDFVYDPELLQHGEVDEKAVLGLRGVVKISHTTVNGREVVNFDGFAPANQWTDFCPSSLPSSGPASQVRP